MFPHTARHVDDIAFLHSVLFFAKQPRPGFYRADDRNRAARLSLPRFLALLRPGDAQRKPARVRGHARRTKPRGYDSIWSSGFLPKSNQPLTLDARLREQIADLARLQGMSDAQQRAQLELLRQLNQAAP